MKKKVGGGHQVTLVGSSPYFEFTPSNPWMMVGWRTAPQTRVELEKPLAAKEVAWVPRLVQAIDAQASRLTLDDGTGLDYDYLVIATSSSCRHPVRSSSARRPARAASGPPTRPR
jgi:sulfide:quinone oxidoreductase